ncbi:MAG: alpha/beta hydrolase [Oscillospiraceae bacterium]|nr:alpha/beta hydrolase [Oscillospiraceae bacterium]
MKENKLIKRLYIIVISIIVIILIATVVIANIILNSAIPRSVVNVPTTYEQTQEVSALLQEYPYTDAYITSDDGLKLYGRVYNNTKANTHNWVITIHGYTKDSDYIADISETFVDNGFNVLAPDLRAHGKSEGNYAGMGWLDRKDILGWINYINSQDSQAKIILWGISMGGATVMMTSGEDSLPSNVVCGIEDCGYTSVWDEFSYQMSQQYGYLPQFPIFNTASLLSKIRAGYSFSEASSVKQLANCKIPMLFIQGDQDTYVPFYMLQQNYDADPRNDKKILVVPGATHAESYTTNPVLYWSTVFTFISKYI